MNDSLTLRHSRYVPDRGRRCYFQRTLCHRPRHNILEPYRKLSVPCHALFGAYICSVPEGNFLILPLATCASRTGIVHEIKQIVSSRGLDTSWYLLRRERNAMPESCQEAWLRVRYIDKHGFHALKPWKGREPTLERCMHVSTKSGANVHRWRRWNNTSN
jgi:hypothetical protein